MKRGWKVKWSRREEERKMSNMWFGWEKVMDTWMEDALIFFLIPSFISNVGDAKESEILDRLTVSTSERKRERKWNEGGRASCKPFCSHHCSFMVSFLTLSCLFNWKIIIFFFGWTMIEMTERRRSCKSVSSSIGLLSLIDSSNSTIFLRVWEKWKEREKRGRK